MEPLKPLAPQEALNELIVYFLGKDWYVVDPLGQTQVNAIAVYEIKHKFKGPLWKIAKFFLVS